MPLTVQQIRKDLIEELSLGNIQNDGSLTAQVHENIQWAWDNWSESIVSEYYQGTEKPESYTDEFRDEWIENEDFDIELQIHNER